MSQKESWKNSEVDALDREDSPLDGPRANSATVTGQ